MKKTKSCKFELTLYRGIKKELPKRYLGTYYTADKNYAKIFGNIIEKKKVCLKNPLIINLPNEYGYEGVFTLNDNILRFYRELTKEDIKELKKRGYDSIIVNVKGLKKRYKNPLEVVILP